MLMRVLLFNFAMPSQALQAQKQTHALVGFEDQGALSRTTETMFTWSETGSGTCDDTCKTLCPSATCNPEAPCSIDSEQSWQKIGGAGFCSGLGLKGAQREYCKSIQGSGACDTGNLVGSPTGPSAKVGFGIPWTCTYHTGGCQIIDHCTKTPPAEEKILCACEVDFGVCSVVEDPHVNVFDGEQISLFAENGATFQEEGDKWLVSSDRVKIQARFMFTMNSPSSNRTLFARAIAVGGDFLDGNVMVVGSLEDDITWNGEPVLQGQESNFSVQGDSYFVDATRGPSSMVQDLSRENPGVNIRLPLGVSLVVNRLHRYINVAIKMPQQAGGQEGMCGNFNGIGADDALAMAVNRFDVNVAPADSLFTGFSFELA